MTINALRLDGYRIVSVMLLPCEFYRIPIKSLHCLLCGVQSGIF